MRKIIKSVGIRIGEQEKTARAIGGDGGVNEGRGVDGGGKRKT